MRSVIQIAPEILTGSGVEGVAYNLEQAFQAAGVVTERFTLVEARGGRVRIVEGDPHLLKVTTPADLELVASWL